MDECVNLLTAGILDVGVTFGWWTAHGVKASLTRDGVFRFTVLVEPILGVTDSVKIVEVTL